MAAVLLVWQRSTQPGGLPLAHGLARIETGPMTDNDFILYTCALLMGALFSTLYWLLKK